VVEYSGDVTAHPSTNPIVQWAQLVFCFFGERVPFEVVGHPSDRGGGYLDQACFVVFFVCGDLLIGAVWFGFGGRVFRMRPCDCPIALCCALRSVAVHRHYAFLGSSPTY
jgi:hypothetical protein